MEGLSHLCEIALVYAASSAVALASQMVTIETWIELDQGHNRLAVLRGSRGHVKVEAEKPYGNGLRTGPHHLKSFGPHGLVALQDKSSVQMRVVRGGAEKAFVYTVRYALTEFRSALGGAVMKPVAGARRCVDLRFFQAARDTATMLLFRGFGDVVPRDIPSIMVSTAVLLAHLGVLQTTRIEDLVVVFVLAIAECEAVKRESTDAEGWHRSFAEAIMRGWELLQRCVAYTWGRAADADVKRYMSVLAALPRACLLQRGFPMRPALWKASMKAARTRPGTTNVMKAVCFSLCAVRSCTVTLQ